ncbi:hypothetical protein JX266_004064 [Neoarthrinium moseri]|nr:hypothetical protein JX266_004064 [Neoarthrinium moseri]
MFGKIALKKAYEIAGMEEKSKHEALLYINSSDRERYMRQISDISDERMRLSNTYSTGYTIVSLTVPGIQGIYNAKEAQRRATEANDWAFPDLKIIVGHLGEHLTYDFWRINHWFEDVKKSIAKEEGGVMCKKTIYDYFKQNIWVTTRGHFCTETLRFVVNQIGADRVLFSVDYPYETIEGCSAWWDGHAEEIIRAVGGVENYRKIGRDNAKAQMPQFRKARLLYRAVNCYTVV